MNARPRSEPTLLGVLATSERMALGVVSRGASSTCPSASPSAHRGETLAVRQISAHLT